MKNNFSIIQPPRTMAAAWPAESVPERGDGKDARNNLAEKYGWSGIPVNHSGTESWEHMETRDRIDYYPMTDRAKTTVKIHPRDARGEDRGNPHNKDLVRDNVGGNRGLEKIFEDVRHHSGTGRYYKIHTRW